METMTHCHRHPEHLWHFCGVPVSTFEGAHESSKMLIKNGYFSKDAHPYDGRGVLSTFVVGRSMGNAGALECLIEHHY
jgi:hypothetical protein